MKQQGLICQRKKKYKRGSSAAVNDPHIAANLVQRQFDVYYPNQVWVSDITYITPYVRIVVVSVKTRNRERLG
jgi:transposase InsO family protein